MSVRSRINGKEAVSIVEIPKIKIQAESSAKERIKSAEKRKMMASESMEESWERIFSLKNSATDAERLRAVKEAMEEGRIGREPVAEGKRQGKFSKAEALRLYRKLADMKREETLRKMVDTTPDNYELITTADDLAAVVSALMEEEVVAVDTETTGVDVYTDTIVGISFTLPTFSVIPKSESGWNVYIPVAHSEDIEQLPLDYVLRELRDFLYSEDVGKVLFNAVFDIAMFRRHSSDLRGVIWDGMTAMHLLNENEPSFKLKDLAPKYLGVESDTFAELFGNTMFSEIPLDIALVYAAKDTELTWKLYEFQRKHMEKMPTILEYYQAVEVPLLYVIVELEANGYVLDLEFAKEYGEELHAKAEELAKWLVDYLTPYHDGEETINLNSPAQMKPAMSKALGRNLPNMDAKKTLKPLASKYEAVAKLLEYKRVTKLSGTYIDTLPTKQNHTTKRWHSRFNPMGTVTGRFSSGKDEEDKSGQGFNVQNQPDEARSMFVAPEGKVLVSADFKAQEIRCVAYLSEEPVLIQAFLEGRDPYAMMASTFYERPYEEVYKLPNGDDTPERKKMKVVWLATLYGMSDKSLGENLGISTKEATAFKDDLFGSMPKLNAWLEANKDFVKKNGFVWADKGARKRRLPEAKWTKKRIPWGRYYDDEFKEARIHNAKIGTAFRQATNARVQGSSSIQTKVTMIKAHEYCSERHGFHVWATVHDEIIFEIPEAEFTQKVADDIRIIMTESYPWGDIVPNGTDLAVGTSWGDMVSESEWFSAE